MKTIILAKNLGITLKKIQTFRGHDGLGINADICLNGKAFAHAYDDARGGMMDITPIDYKKENKEIIENINLKLKALPEHEVVFGNSKFMSRDTLEDIVNALVDEQDLQKRIKAAQKKGLVIQTPDGCDVLSWKAGTIEGMLKKYGAVQVLPMIQKAYDDNKKEGAVILNLEYLKSIGIKI